MYAQNFRTLSDIPSNDRSDRGELRRSSLETPCANQCILKSPELNERCSFTLKNVRKAMNVLLIAGKNWKNRLQMYNFKISGVEIGLEN